MKKQIFFLIFFLILIPTVFAINATSGNYSVAMFGSGLQSSTPGSTNYNATSLLTYLASTRGANTTTYTANIGFFENTTYNRSVIITAYSISPTSAEVGSTIDLSISAINAQEVWANITSPNNQVQRLTLINGQTVTFLPSPSVVGTYTVIFYANSSTGAIASAVDTFELTAVSTSGGGSGGSGGGGGGITSCTYNWDCTAWSLCADGKQTRTCKNIGSCIGTESKPIEEMVCSEALFDVMLKLRDMSLTENKSLIFNYDLTEKIGIEKIDVHLKYSIINSKNDEIFSQIETIAIQNTLNVEKEIDEIKFVDGKYILRIDVLYGNLQRAFAEQSFEVKDGQIIISEIPPETIVSGLLGTVMKVLSILIIIIIVIISIIIWWRRRKRKLPNTPRSDVYGYLAEGVRSGFSVRLLKQKLLEAGFGESEIDASIERLNKKIAPTNKRKYLIYGLAILIIICLVLLAWFTITRNITGNVVGNDSSYDGRIILATLILIMIGLLLHFRKDIVYLLEEFRNKITGEGFSHKVFDLKNKRVYTESGDHIGKVKEVILKENKIDSLKIKLKKGKGFKAKGITLKYNQVKAVKGIVIIKNFEIDGI